MGETILNGFALETAGKLDKLEYIHKARKDGSAVWIDLLYFFRLFGEDIRKLHLDYRLKG